MAQYWRKKLSIALIDNSTISSVQRVLGEIEVKSKGTIDGDIAAFESLITSILFYNEHVIIDDYKEKFSEQRKKTFHLLSLSIQRILISHQYKLKLKKNQRRLVPRFKMENLWMMHFKISLIY